jgi:hypothetical protein
MMELLRCKIIDIILVRTNMCSVLRGCGSGITVYSVQGRTREEVTPHRTVWDAKMGISTSLLPSNAKRNKTAQKHRGNGVLAAISVSPQEQFQKY